MLNHCFDELLGRPEMFHRPTNDEGNASRARQQISQYQKAVDELCIHTFYNLRGHLLADASSARFNRKTFTPGSPRTPKSAESVFCLMSSPTLSALKPRALATRAVCSSALRKLMCGSSPLPEAVTASAGTESVSFRPFSVRYAAMRSLMASLNFCEVGPRLLPLELAAS